MTDRPMIFSAPMIAALLDGRKTQTRRVMKPQPTDRMGQTTIPPTLLGRRKHDAPYFDRYHKGPFWCWWDEYDRQGPDWIKEPCQPGDRLWVREAFARAWELDGDDSPSTEERTYYRADGEPFDQYQMPDGTMRDGVPWKPSIHMPRWASRITLVVTDVRPERVQNISDDDVAAEGGGLPPSKRFGDHDARWIAGTCRDCKFAAPNDEKSTRILHGCPFIVGDDRDVGKPLLGGGCNSFEIRPDSTPEPPRLRFKALWDSIHGFGAWNRNDWVWRIAFTAHACNIDRMEEDQ